MKHILLAAALLGAAPAFAQDVSDDISDAQRYWEISPEKEKEIHEREIREGRSCRTDGCYLEGLAVGLLLFWLPTT